MRQRYISKKWLYVLIPMGVLSGTFLPYSQHVHSNHCLCHTEVVAAAESGISAAVSALSIETLWQQNLQNWVDKQTTSWVQDDTNRQIQSIALSTDSVNKNVIDMSNTRLARELQATPERCTTEAFGKAIVTADENQRTLVASLNRKTAELITAGESKPVARVRADVSRNEQDGEYLGLDTILHITNPVKPYNTDKERAAARAFVDRIVESVSLPPLPASSKDSNKGLLYKKARLDYMATVQLVNHSFNEAIAQNTAQSGLLAALQGTLDDKDEDAKKLLQDIENKALTSASRNTLLQFELKRRLSHYWQKKIQGLSESSLNREINNLLIIKNYALKEELDLNMRTELLLAALLSQELKGSGEISRLQAIYAELN